MRSDRIIASAETKAWKQTMRFTPAPRHVDCVMPRSLLLCGIYSKRKRAQPIAQKTSYTVKAKAQCCRGIHCYQQ